MISPAQRSFAWPRPLGPWRTPKLPSTPDPMRGLSDPLDLMDLLDISDLIDALSDPSSTEGISESRPQGSRADTRPSLHYLVCLGLGEPLQLLAEPSQLDPELISNVPRVVGQCARDLRRMDPVGRIQDGCFRPMNKTSSPCLPLYNSLLESLISPAQRAA